MRKIIILIVFGLIFLWGCGTKKGIKNSYTIAIDSGGEYPFNYKDKKTGKISGFESDLIREIARRGNFKINFIEKPFSLIISNVAEGKIDMGIGLISIIEERKKTLKFSEPYMEILVVTLANKENKIENNEKEIFGFAKGTYFEFLIKNKENVEIVEEIDTNKVIEKLRLKEIDYAITSKEVGEIYMAKYPEIYEKNVLQKDSIGIAFSKETSYDFINKIDNIILQMKLDGFLDNLKKKYGI